MTDVIKILIADDHPLLTEGLKMTIDGWRGFETAGVASNGKEAMELCEKEHPDIVLMDMQMPVMSGAEAAICIKKAFPETRIVVLTTFYDAETVDAAIKAGCDGFLLKTIESEQLKTSLLSIMNGISVIDRDAMEQLRRREIAQAGVNFTEREKRLLDLICRGLSNKEIAEQLSLQPGTVKNMVSILLNKTFCVSRADLTRYAMEHRLV